MTSMDPYSSTTMMESSEDQAWWQNPLVTAFGIVGILFVLTVILGIVNLYIWYVEKQKKNHWTDTEYGIKKRSLKDKVASPRNTNNVSRTHLQINMSRSNVRESGSSRTSLGRQTSVAGRK